MALSIGDVCLLLEQQAKVSLVPFTTALLGSISSLDVILTNSFHTCLSLSSVSGTPAETLPETQTTYFKYITNEDVSPMLQQPKGQAQPRNAGRPRQIPGHRAPNRIHIYHPYNNFPAADLQHQRITHSRCPQPSSSLSALAILSRRGVSRLQIRDSTGNRVTLAWNALPDPSGQADGTKDSSGDRHASGRSRMATSLARNTS